MKFIHFIKDGDIHLIDYSGKITLDDGISRMETLAEYFSSSVTGDLIKVIFDVRKTEWDSLQAHGILSATFRKTLNRQMFYKKILLAVLNDRYQSPVSENEHWFTKEEDAIRWLGQR